MKHRRTIQIPIDKLSSCYCYCQYHFHEASINYCDFHCVCGAANTFITAWKINAGIGHDQQSGHQVYHKQNRISDLWGLAQKFARWKIIPKEPQVHISHWVRKCAKLCERLVHPMSFNAFAAIEVVCAMQLRRIIMPVPTSTCCILCRAIDTRTCNNAMCL